MLVGLGLFFSKNTAKIARHNPLRPKANRRESKKCKVFLEMLGELSGVGEDKKAGQRKVKIQHLLRLRKISWTVPKLAAREAASLLVRCSSWVFILDYLG